MMQQQDQILSHGLFQHQHSTQQPFVVFHLARSIHFISNLDTATLIVSGEVAGFCADCDCGAYEVGGGGMGTG